MHLAAFIADLVWRRDPCWRGVDAYDRWSASTPLGGGVHDKSGYIAAWATLKRRNLYLNGIRARISAWGAYNAQLENCR